MYAYNVYDSSVSPDDNGRVSLAADPELVEENNPENSTQTCDNTNHKTEEKSELDRTRARANFLNALTCSSIPSPKVHSELRFLNLGLCSKVTDHCLRQIAMNCPDLRELDIKGCFNTTDLGISYIARGCQGLKLLNISSGSMIQKMCLTDQSLVSIATYCKGLRQLFIEKNPLMSLDGYKNLFDHCSLPCTVSLTTKSPEILKTDILSMDSGVNSCKRVNVFCRGCYKGNIYHLDVLLYNSDGHILE